MAKSRLSLKRQVDRFCKSGFKYRYFTEDLYRMLYIDTNRFIAHYDRDGFYKVRFQQDAENTIDLLAGVKKPELKELCHTLAAAMTLRLHPEVFVKHMSSVVCGPETLKEEEAV